MGGYYRRDRKKHDLCPSTYCKHNYIILNDIIICIESSSANYRWKTKLFEFQPLTETLAIMHYIAHLWCPLQEQLLKNVFVSCPAQQ